MVRRIASVALICSPMIALVVACSTTPGAALGDLQKSCAALDIATNSADGVLGGGAKTTAQKVAAPGNAFCALVKAGTVPANADANSINWLQNDIAAAVNTITALAK